MNNQTTGALIRAKRTALDLTQKDLAERLNVTNSAVSKWERGLCAPDIALLGKLAEILGITVTELIGGEAPQNAVEEIEKSVQDALRYSEKEAAIKKRTARRRILLTAIICTVAAAGLCLGILWKHGIFDVIERVPSPDGRVTLTVYDRNIHDLAVAAPAVTVRERGHREGNFVFGGCTYEDAWWSPDSTMYVIAMHHKDEGRMMWLESLKTNSTSNLCAYLSMAVTESKLDEYNPPMKGGLISNISYRFLQWSDDSSAMLIFYAFIGGDEIEHSGYFWYSLADGNLYGLLELQ